MKKLNWSLLIIILVFLFLLGPLLILFFSSFGETLTFPPRNLTIAWYPKVIGMRFFREAFKTSLILGFGATLAALFLGIPAAYALTRFSFIGKSVIENVFISPLIVPALVIGFSLLRFFVQFVNFPILLGLFLGHTVLLFPYTVRVTSASLKNFDFQIEEAAISLGAPPLKSFFYMVLPNIRVGVLSAFILSFATSFNNVPVSLMLTGPGMVMLPIQMLTYMEYYYDPSIAALSVLIMIFIVLITQITERLLGLSKYL